jgi:uncharacterized protein YcbK (DUF882 family)
MISFKELLAGNSIADVPLSYQHNLQALQKKMNTIRAAYAKPMIVTSGFRSEQQHLRIYSKHKKNPPMGSHHLRGNACDIYDPNQELQKWVLNNVELLEELGLWCEDFSATRTWVHFQQLPPKSGKRFFLP